MNCIVWLWFSLASLAHSLLCQYGKLDGWDWNSHLEEIREALHAAEQPDFGQIRARQRYKELLKLYPMFTSTSLRSVDCPIGLLTMRIFVVWLTNDADRCINFRDQNLGIEVLTLPFTEIIRSGWPLFTFASPYSAYFTRR